MSLKIWLLNLLLAMTAGVFGFEAYTVWSEVERNPPKAGSVENNSIPSQKKIPVHNFAGEKSYEAVAVNDLFSPARKELEKEDPAPEPSGMSPEAGKAPGKLYLNGVVLAEGYQAALVRTAGPSGGEKKEKWVRIGDSIGTMRVVEITREKIVVEHGTERQEVLLHDQAKPRERLRAHGGEAAPTIIATGSGQPEEARKVPPVPTSEAPAAVTGSPASEKEKVEDTSPFGGPRHREQSVQGTTAEGKPVEPVKNPLVELLKKVQEQSGTRPQAPAGNPFEKLLQPKAD